jgi:magnesium chelatase subunit I
VIVTGLRDSDERLLVYERVKGYKANPRALIQSFEVDTFHAREDVITAREMLPTVQLAPEAQKLGLCLVQELSIHSHRAEFTMFEAARAYAAADMREQVTVEDLRAVAPLALRMRRSDFIDRFVASQQTEDQEITDLLDQLKGEDS